MKTTPYNRLTRLLRRIASRNKTTPTASKKKGKDRKEGKYRDIIAAEYLQKRAHLPDWHEETLILGHLISQLPNQLEVLDIPFGTGRFMPLYASKLFRVNGMDISSDMLEIAQTYNRPDIAEFQAITGDATDLPLADSSIDLVVSYRFLGYILTVERAKLAIQELVRITRSYVILQLQYLKDGEQTGQQDKLGDKLTWPEQEEFLKSLNLEIMERIDTFSKDQYQNTILLARKSPIN